MLPATYRGVNLYTLVTRFLFDKITICTTIDKVVCGFVDKMKTKSKTHTTSLAISEMALFVSLPLLLTRCPCPLL